jgi:hypothetical protein
MEFVLEILEEQKEGLMESLRWSEGDERKQDNDRLDQVVEALTVLKNQ